jgi:hypothetical protein
MHSRQPDFRDVRSESAQRGAAPSARQRRPMWRTSGHAQAQAGHEYMSRHKGVPAEVASRGNSRPSGPDSSWAQIPESIWLGTREDRNAMSSQFLSMERNAPRAQERHNLPTISLQYRCLCWGTSASQVSSSMWLLSPAFLASSCRSRCKIYSLSGTKCLRLRAHATFCAAYAEQFCNFNFRSRGWHA